MNTQTQKRGKGRPVGATSFVTMTLAELNARFGPNETIPVGRLFLEKGVVKANPQTIAATPVVEETTPAVEMTLSE